MRDDEITEKEREDIIECAKAIQSDVFRNVDPEESFKKMIKTYSQNVVRMAMNMVKASRESINDEGNEIAQCVNRCMVQVDRKKLDKIGNSTCTIDEFYEICEEAYGIFMNDEFGRALPIVFMYVKGNKTIGVVPIDVHDHSESPMDYLKEIVYSEKPDAYCFCGEGAMSSNVELSEHKYGDIISDPSSKDVVILQGNNKTGDKPLHKLFNIVEKDGKIVELTPVEDLDVKSMESEKLP